MAIMYYCSDGSRVSQAQINTKYYEARRNKYYGQGHRECEGCGGQAQGSAHIIAQARCKTLHKTELIWDPNNFFPACHSCNQAIENPKGEAWRGLKNRIQCLVFMSIHDHELFTKFNLNL